MNPPTGQGTGDLKPPWPCPGESRSGSLKVLSVISPSLSLHASWCVCFFVLIIENSFQRCLNLKFPYSQAALSWLCAGECFMFPWGCPRDGFKRRDSERACPLRVQQLREPFQRWDRQCTGSTGTSTSSQSTTGVYFGKGTLSLSFLLLLLVTDSTHHWLGPAK